MASFKLNVAKIRGLPTGGKLVSALKDFGMPSGEEFGVLSCSFKGDSVSSIVIYRSTQSIRQLDPSGQEIISTAIERIRTYQVQMTPAKDRIETYEGSANGIERIQAFLSSQLSLPVVTEAIELDVARAVEKLSTRLERFQLRSIRMEGYSPKSYMIGTYCPRFSDTEHALEFLAEHDEGVLGASIRFAGPRGLVGATITQNACFTYFCDHENKEFAQNTLRRLA